MKKFLLTLLASASLTTFAQTYELVEDINKDGSGYSFSSNINQIIELNGKLYFSARNFENGQELFSFDGTSHDIAADAFPGAHDFLNPKHSTPIHITAFGDEVFFMADLGRANGESTLCKYNTVDDSFEVVDSLDCTHNAAAFNTIFTYDGELYYGDFIPNTNFWQILKYNAGSAPTVVSSTGMSTATSLIPVGEFNNKFYIAVGNSTHAMHEFDGTSFSPAPGTNMLAYVHRGVVFNNTFYIYGRDNAVITGGELYKYDGVNAPTLVHDVFPGPSNASITGLVEFNNRLYFSAAYSSNEMELHYIDANENLTTIDINPTGSGRPSGITLYNNKLYFRAVEPNGNYSLYEYDGTNNPTVIDSTSTGYTSWPSNFIVFDNKLFFSAENDSVSNELHSYNGTEIALEANIYDGSLGSNITQIVEFKGDLYFGATGIYGKELYKYDGTSVSLVADIDTSHSASGPNSSNPINLFIYDDELYFRTYFQGIGYVMYKYDGTNPPVEVPQMSGYARSFRVYKDKLYYSGTLAGDNEVELLVYDGTTTSMVHEINQDGSSYPLNLMVFDDKLYFTAYDSVAGDELFVYDGVNTPSMVADIYSGLESSYPGGLVEYNNKLYFTAMPDSLTGTEMMVYDGVNPPTLAFDLFPGMDPTNPSYANDGYPYNKVVYGDKLYFCSAAENVTGYQIFSYDGVNTPTQITNYNIASASHQFHGLGVYDDKLFYWADEGNGYGSELYIYDTLDASPVMVDELSPGIMNSKPTNPSNFIEYKGYIYFAATEVYYDNSELYRIKGTPDSTISIAKINKGEAQLELYPNPTTGEVNIKTNEKVNKVEVYDVSGSCVGIYNDARFSLSNLTNGLYLIRVYTPSSVKTSRVVKE